MLNVRWCILLLLTVNCLAIDLCSNKKSDNKCLCKRYTDYETSLPNTVADCSMLNIKEFPDLSALPEEVNILDLSLNHIKILDPANCNVSSKNLKRLILSHNNINYVDDRFFLELPNLRVLDLSYNNITSLEDGDIFKNLKQLTHLDLSFNYLNEMPDNVLDPLQSLKHFDVSYNPLGHFLMQSKDVLDNTIGLSPHITHLGLENVGLNDLSSSYFDSFVDLKHLSLADNNLDIIPNVPYSLEYLDLSGNNLTFVSAKYLNYHSLKTLKLNRMESLTSIHHYAFYNLQSLEKLIITDCPNLREFTELAFGLASKTTQLHPKTLTLARNGLQSLNETYKYMFRKMEHIDLRHNPWNCDCDILWLLEFETELFKGYDVRCNSPRQVKNKQVLDLKESDLQECYPEIYGKKSHRILIVVLMTSVIILMGLIFYLVRYPKSWLSPKTFGVGPNSPYNPAPTMDG